MSQAAQDTGDVRLVYCLSVDMIASTSPGLRMTQGELDRFNRALVAQLEPHVEALAFEDLLVKFTGDGWLLMSPELADAERLCALATIMRHRFGPDMERRTGLAATRIPPLRMAVCAGRDVRVRAWRGGFDWVGDSARRATRSALYCFPDEVLVDANVQSVVLRDFVVQRIDPNARPGAPPPRKKEEELALYSLGDLRIEAAEDWDAPAAYVYALGQIGRPDDATEASMRAASRLDRDEYPAPGPGARARDVAKWNRLIATAPNYDATLELLERLMESPAQPNVDTLNVLLDRSPTYDEALRWVATFARLGVHADVVSYHTLIRRAPDYRTAVALLTVMDAADVAPTVGTLRALIARAPTGADAYQALGLLADYGVAPDVEIFGRLMSRISDYDAAVELLEAMPRWGVVPDAEVINRLIVLAPDYGRATEWLDGMDERQVEPDAETFNALIGRAPRYGAALGWLEEMRRRGIAANVTTYNTVLARAPSHEVAQALLRQMERSDIQPTSETFKTLIARAPDYPEALNWLAEMERRGIRPNNEVFRALIAQAPGFEAARLLLDDMPAHDVAPNTETFRELMGRAPGYGLARELLDEMRARGVPPTAETFKTLVAMAPDEASAADLMAALDEAGIRPDADLFVAFIAHARSFADARRWFDRMVAQQVAPTSDALTALLRRAGSYAEAVAVLEELRDRVPPNEGSYRTLVESAPDAAAGRAWIEEMVAGGMRPSVGILSALFSKPPGEATGDELLAWYLGLPHHPSAPMQAAIDTHREAGRVEDALRLALDYPHIEAARTVFRLHPEEALAYLEAVVVDDPSHANGRYALGLALLELQRPKDALVHLEMALELARPGPRVAALEEIIRHARDWRPG